MQVLPIELWSLIGAYAPNILQVSRHIVTVARRARDIRIEELATTYSRSPLELFEFVIRTRDVGVWNYYWPRWCGQASYQELMPVANIASHHCHYRTLAIILQWAAMCAADFTEPMASLCRPLLRWVARPHRTDLESVVGMPSAIMTAHWMVVCPGKESDDYLARAILENLCTANVGHAICYCIYYNRLEHAWHLYHTYREYLSGFDKLYVFIALLVMRDVYQGKYSLDDWKERLLDMEVFATYATTLANCWRGAPMTSQELGHMFLFDFLRPPFLLHPGMPKVMLERWPFPYSAQRDRQLLLAFSDTQKRAMKAAQNSDRVAYAYYEAKFCEHGIEF